MENLETPYEEETEFIECSVCEKSLRGETLYKIHLTTAAHIKKEDAIVAAGRAVRKHTVPEFKDIVQYLDYLKLDEPIIGLSFLDELHSIDQQGPRYFCRLCHYTANLAEMVHHVIGRKHRQKYVELKRQDLVTWDKESIITQGGKIIRARAEIIERQDGRGTPVVLARRGTEGKLNISRVPPREKQNRTKGQRSTEHNVPPLLPELKGYSNSYSNRAQHVKGYQNTLQFHPDEPDLNRGRRMCEGDNPLGRGYVEENLRRADYKESDAYRREFIDQEDSRTYGEQYDDDPQDFSSPMVAPEPSGFSRYNSMEERPLSQTPHLTRYPEMNPSRKRPFPENDPLTEFYTEEIRRRRGHSAESQPSHRTSQGEQQWSLKREPGHDSMIRAGRQGSSEPETEMGGIRDYRHGRREPHQTEIMSYSGLGRTEPSISQRHLDVTRTICDIPEPFRRFLKGDATDESSKRKRKSRFSDATAEEVEMTKEMFSDGRPDPRFGGCPRGAGVSVRPEILGTQHPDNYSESKSPHFTENYQKGGFGSEGVLDMLKNIEIENAEEADFLKNKLCSLLKEFRSKKLEKTMQNSQGRAVNNNNNDNYGSLKTGPQLSPAYHYKTMHQEDLDFRRSELFLKEDHRERARIEQDNRFKDYLNLRHGEARCSNISLHKESFGWTNMSGTPRPAEPPYAERFQEPTYPRDYQPGTEERFTSHSVAPLLHMGQASRMDRGSRYSSSLDKITSTLLELVARK